MDKINKVNTCMPAEFISSCEDLVSFSGDEIDNLVNENLRCNHGYDNQSFYSLRIKLFGNCGYSGCACGKCDCNKAVNCLSLDNLGDKYFYVDGTATIDNKHFNPDFKLSGVCTEIYSNKDSRLLKLDVVDNKCVGVDCQCYKSLEQGFNLSDVIRNIGDFNNLTPTVMGSKGNICINQKSYFVNKCGKTYVIFKFNLLNNGNDLVQKILFNDVFPENVFKNSKCVFLNGCRVCSRNIFLDNNRMTVKLPNLGVGQELCLMIVGVLCGDSMRESNFATISYVSGYFKCENKTVIDICQKNSNVKII